MMDEEPKISFAIAATCFPFIAYSLAYAFEFGYARYFLVPLEFVEVGVADVAKFSVILLPFMVLIYLVALPLMARSRVRDHYTHRRIRILTALLMCVFLSVLILASEGNGGYTFVIIGFFLVFLATDFFLIRSQCDKQAGNGIISQRVLSIFVASGIVLTFVVSSAYAGGLLYAGMRSRYPELVGSPDWFLIGNRGDLAILAEAKLSDEKGRRLTRRIQFVSVESKSSGEARIFEVKSSGRLRRW